MPNHCLKTGARLNVRARFAITDDNEYVLEEITLLDGENLKHIKLDTLIELARFVIEVIENHFEVKD